MSLYRKNLLIPALGKEAWELGLEFAENCLMKQFWGGGGVRFTGYIDQRNAVHVEHPVFLKIQPSFLEYLLYARHWECDYE